MCDISIGKSLGSGTFSKVYEVRYKDPILGIKNEAFKLYKKGRFQESFPEVDISMKIKCDSLLRALELKTSSGKCKKIFGNSEVGLILEKITGNVVKLFKKIKVASNMKILVCYKLLIQICQALDCLRNAGYYHFDIKPLNIFYKCDLTHINNEKDLGKLHFFLGDYGLCLPIDNNDNKPIKIEGSTVVGTFMYLGPELIRPDIFYAYFSSCSWMLALSILEIISGHDHYDANLDNSVLDDHEQVFENLTNNFYPFVENYISETLETIQDEKFSQIIQMMMRIDPRKRLDPQQVLEITSKNPLLKKFNSENCFISQLKINIENVENFELQKIFLKILFRIQEYEVKPSLRVICQTLMHLIYLDEEISNDFIDISLALSSQFYNEETEFTFLDEDYSFFIKKLDGIIFFNPLFINSFSRKKIISTLNLIFSHPEKFKEKYKDDFQEEGEKISNSDKNSSEDLRFNITGLDFVL